MKETPNAAVHEALGAQLRTMRERLGVTQDQLARALARHGVRWTRSRVGQVERGDGALDVTTLHALALALRELSGGDDVRLADLLPESSPSERVQLLREALAGNPVRGPLIGAPVDWRLAPGWGPVEDAVVRAVGEGSEGYVITAARRLYGHTGTQERDRRAGPDAVPQRRGAMGQGVVKELVAEVEAELAQGEDEDG